MKKRNIAVVIFYTNSKKILLQKRDGISKSGEEWAFFGGQIEKGETPKLAAIREIREEIDYDLKELEYLGKNSAIIKRINSNELWKITCENYITKVKEDLSQFTVLEGDGAQFFSLSEAKKLKLTPKIDYDIINIIEKFLNNKETK